MLPSYSLSNCAAKTPKCQETSWSIQAVTWPVAQKTKNPDNLKQLTPPQLSLPSMLRCIFPAASCSFFQVWTQSAACSRPPKPMNETSIFFRECYVFLQSRRRVLFNKITAVSAGLFPRAYRSESQAFMLYRFQMAWMHTRALPVDSYP